MRAVAQLNARKGYVLDFCIFTDCTKQTVLPCRYVQIADGVVVPFQHTAETKPILPSKLGFGKFKTACVDIFRNNVIASVCRTAIPRGIRAQICKLLQIFRRLNQFVYKLHLNNERAFHTIYVVNNGKRQNVRLLFLRRLFIRIRGESIYHAVVGVCDIRQRTFFRRYVGRTLHTNDLLYRLHANVFRVANKLRKVNAQIILISVRRLIIHREEVFRLAASTLIGKSLPFFFAFYPLVAMCNGNRSGCFRTHNLVRFRHGNLYRIRSTCNKVRRLYFRFPFVVGDNQR